MNSFLFLSIPTYPGLVEMVKFGLLMSENINSSITELTDSLQKLYFSCTGRWNFNGKFYSRTAAVECGGDSLYILKSGGEESDLFIKCGSQYIHTGKDFEVLLNKMKESYSLRQSVTLEGWQYECSDFMVKYAVVLVGIAPVALLIQTKHKFLPANAMLDEFCAKICSFSQVQIIPTAEVNRNEHFQILDILINFKIL